MTIDLYKCIKYTNQTFNFITKHSIDVTKYPCIQKDLNKYAFDFVISYSDYHENIGDVQWHLYVSNIDIDDDYIKNDVGYVFKLILTKLETFADIEFIKDFIVKRYVSDKKELHTNINICNSVESECHVQINFEHDIYNKFIQGESLLIYDY